jgi:DNA-binding NtrC family response regulator
MPDKLRVLLVDDEVGLLESLTRLLTRRGISVRTATNGRLALDLLSREQFDVVVLDVRMPVMDGLAALREIRRTDSLTPVLLFSGHSDLEYVSGALKGGGTDYLLKPCDAETFISAIETASERKTINLEVKDTTGGKKPRRKT